MAKRLLYILTLVLFSKLVLAQCPQIYDYLGNLSNKPYFVSCTGSSSYNMNIASNTNWGAYSINWGDGTSDNVGASYNANSLINHIYNSATPDTFVITITIPSLNCTLTGVAVMEKPVNASIQIPIGGVTTACAPKALQFTNSSTDVSETTQFTWNFGDGSPAETYNHTNSGQTVTHTYNKGTVNCQTAVTLTAKNYCTPIPTIANFNPIQIYDIDDAAITPSAFVKCWPDNTFNFSNTTNRNCVPQGNTFQRQEKWNFGNYWGLGHDSIINWKPWPPTSPITISYPSVGSYSVQLQDSNLCGVDVQVITVSIVNPPTAGVIAPAGPFCQGSSVTFTNTSATGYLYKWNFGTGGGFVSRPFGPQSFTYNTPGTYTISVVALIAGGGSSCTDTDRVVINILPQPTANFSISSNKGCNSLNGVVYTDNSVDAVSWNWNFGNGNTFNGSNPPSQNYNSIGTFVTSLTVTAANTCSHTYTNSVTVYQIPTAAFSPSSACAGSPASFTDISTHAVGDPITSWNWDFGDASPTATSSVQNSSHTYSSQNTYTVQLIVNTANCTDTVLQPIVINIKPTADFSLTPINGCPTLTVNFTNASSNASSYTWDFGNGNNSIAENTSATFTNTLTTNKTYTITLTAGTGSGCSDTHSTIVTVFPKPKASFTVSAPTGCSPIAATFTNNSIGATSYNWNFGDNTTSTSTLSVFSHTYVNSTLLIQTYTTQLVATSTNGCKDSTSITVTAYPRPIFNFTMIPSSGCSPLNINFPPVLGAVSYEWDFGDGSPKVFTANPNHVFTNTTTVNQTYTVQLIATNAFSCIDTTYGYPLVSPKPVSDFSLTPNSGCSPLISSFANLSSGATAYIWNYGDATPTSSLTNANHTFVNASNVSQTFTVQLISLNAFSCSDTSYKSITVLPKPNASLTHTPNSGCSPLNVNFSNTSTGVSSYTLNYGDGSPSSINISAPHTFTNSTLTNLTRTISLIVENSFSCYDTLTSLVTVSPRPTSNFSVSPTTGCSPLFTSYNNSSLNAISYIWDYGDGSPTSILTNAPHIFTNNGTSSETRTVSLISTNSFLCSDTIRKTVTVLPKPNASFTQTPSVLCSPVITSFTNSTTGATSYTWDYGDGSANENNLTPSHTFTNNSLTAETRTITLTVSNAFGCRDTAYSNIQILPKPNALFLNSPLNGCSPHLVSYTNTSTGALTYTWSYGDGSASSNIPSGTHTFTNVNNSIQSYITQLIVSNAFNCNDTVNVTSAISPKPSAAFSFSPTSGCSPLPINFSNISSGATTYTWNYGDGSPSSLLQNPSHTFVNATANNITYTTQLVVENIFNCKDTATGVPLVLHKPIPNFSLSPNNGCSPLTVTFTNTSTQAINYLWKFGDGTNSSTSDPTNQYTNNGASNLTFTCTLIASTFNGCSDSIKQTINVFNRPIAGFSVDTPACSPKTIHFMNTSVGGASYLWDFGTATSNNINASHQFINSTTSNISQTVQLIATSSNNCKDTISGTIIIHPKPEFTIIASPDSGCTALSVNFPLINNAVNYQWNFGDGNFSSSANATNVFYNTTLTDKTYTVQLIGTDGYGCKDTSYKNIKVFTRPTAQFQANPTTMFVPIGSVNCTNLSAGAISYLWDFGDSNSSTAVNPSHSYSIPGEFQITLIATSANGCKDTFALPSKIIAVLESDIDVPNAFSPNPNGGNGGVFNDKDISNDVFHPVIKGVDKYELNIFSRWGELLFVSEDVNIGWDGYYKGKLCTQDVYIWKINATTIDGKKINKTGDLLLLR